MIRMGVDPDIKKSGFAYMDNGKLITLDNLPYCPLCYRLATVKAKARERGRRLMVTIEAGWLIKKSNWHPSQGRAAEKIAKNVGENHAVGKLIAEYCEYWNVPYELVKPRGKIKHNQFKKITGWIERTNQETRDAAMLIWGRS